MSHPLIMTQMHTVYDFSQKQVHLTFLFPLLFTIIGIYVLAYTYGLITYYIAFLFGRFRTRQQAIFTGFMFVIIGGFITILVYNDNYKTYHHYQNIYKKHQYESVKGRVTDFHHSTDKVHDAEHFSVSGVYFEFGDNSTEGYGYSLADRDVIKPNLLVRISYFNNGDRNVILKLETE